MSASPTAAVGQALTKPPVATSHRVRHHLSWALTRFAVYGVPTVLILAPMTIFLLYSFWSLRDGTLSRQLTLSNYAAFLDSASYRAVFVGTLELTATVGIISLIVGYIVAYLIWRIRGSLRYFMLLFSVIPLSMSYIVKIYAMRSILGYNGFLNGSLLALDIIRQPSKVFLFNQTAVMITMAVIYLPYAILPIFLSLERIPPSLVAASADLGAKPGQTFWRVVFPLSLPGSVVGALFVIVFALGDFLTPQMVGGNQGFTFGRAIWSQFGMAFNWPFGSALAVVLLLAVAVILSVAGFVSGLARVR